ncbi:uncharacterized protein F4812DRAFT_439479 [Daldinia caldariorum]|uniref:uncharacterized protein n=1 Tax=Daldinia caldariorum TaxID=326644 RepID=UPI00200802F3|nr:uncharacterized protein F4812DRAFT_439479 [Daldinia caldariorum]KAI1465084.1 hypothetical protein F4812DRAFT_439479 [Daldinia caldariorum]
MDRDEIVDFISPSKYFAWNLQPSKDGKSGSIEFRRPPGVDTAKKAKHWIAFTMAFVWMSVKFSPEAFIDASSKVKGNFRKLYHPDFQEQLLLSARDIGEYSNLDPRLQQEDDMQNLHITMMDKASFEWLNRDEAINGAKIIKSIIKSFEVAGTKCSRYG